MFQVMFSDGIRPGGDLTDLDGSSDRPRSSGRRSGSSRGSGGSSSSGSSSGGSGGSSRSRRGYTGKMSSKGTAEIGRSLIPHEDGRLPDIVVKEGEEDVLEDLEAAIRDNKRKVEFRLNRNLFVTVCVVKCEKNWAFFRR